MNSHHFIYGIYSYERFHQCLSKDLYQYPGIYIYIYILLSSKINSLYFMSRVFVMLSIE